MVKKLIFVISAIVSILCLAGYGYAWYTKPPEIQTKKIELLYGSEFNINKIKTSKDVVSIKLTKGSVNTKQLGEQFITVEAASKRDVSVTADVRIMVVDKEPPVITIEDEITVEAKQALDIRKRVSVIDNVEGNIKDSLHISSYSTDKIGHFNVLLESTDSSHNITTKTIKLTVIDTSKPTIHSKDIRLTEGETVNLLDGITAEDTIDGDLTDKIEVVGKVGTNKPGTYQITYKVKDNSNNETKQSNIVEVKSKYAPMTIYFNSKAIPYSNGGKESGQSIIDGGSLASTWGGVSVFDGDDGLHTHFIGHNPGPFDGIQKAQSFAITDGKGNVFTYRVTRVYQVDDYAVGIDDNMNYWNRITGTSGGERVTFQSCVNNSVNWIVEAVIK